MINALWTIREVYQDHDRIHAIARLAKQTDVINTLMLRRHKEHGDVDDIDRIAADAAIQNSLKVVLCERLFYTFDTAKQHADDAYSSDYYRDALNELREHASSLGIEETCLDPELYNDAQSPLNPILGNSAENPGYDVTLKIERAVQSAIRQVDRADIILHQGLNSWHRGEHRLADLAWTLMMEKTYQQKILPNLMPALRGRPMIRGFCVTATGNPAQGSTNRYYKPEEYRSFMTRTTDLVNDNGLDVIGRPDLNFSEGSFVYMSDSGQSTVPHADRIESLLARMKA